jgi:GT2 family glycosyltransferase
MNDKQDHLVSIIVVTKAVKDYLFKCLQSIRAQSYSFTQVIVIDNSLDSNFAQNVRCNFSWVQVYSSPVNLFYTASLNKGIELSEGEFILCLNDDVCLDKEFIKEALKGFFLRKDIGMIGGKVLRSGKNILDSTGLYLSVFRTAQERGYGKPDIGQFKEEGRIFGPSGAVAFYRRKMLDQIKGPRGYFDTDLVMFYEDLDLAWRANMSKWKGYYMPKAIAYHARGGSFRPDSGLNRPIARRYLDDTLHACLIKNRYLVIIKNENIPGFALHIIPVLLYDICVWIYTGIFYPKVIKIFFRNIRFLYDAVQERKMRLCQ